MTKHIPTLLLWTAALGAGAASATTIGFETVSAAGNPIVPSYTEAGFIFTSGHMHLVAPSATFASNGTQSLAEEAGSLGLPITMAKIGGGTFSLTSLDAAEVFVTPTAGFPDADVLLVLGTFPDSSTIFASFALDGVLDGTGGVDDYQHFVLPAGFAGLASVVFSGALVTGAPGGISLDNIVADGVTPTPEPGNLALVGLGLALAALSLRRRNP